MLITKNIYFDWQINPGLITMKQEPSFLYTTEMYDDEGFLAVPRIQISCRWQVWLVFGKHVFFEI